MYHWPQFRCKGITLHGAQRLASSIHSRTQGHEQVEKGEWRKERHKQNYTWGQASEMKVCIYLWSYNLIQIQADRSTQTNFSIGHFFQRAPFFIQYNWPTNALGDIWSWPLLEKATTTSSTFPLEHGAWLFHGTELPSQGTGPSLL